MLQNTSSTIIALLAAVIVIGVGSSVAIYLGRKTRDSDSWIVAGRSLPLYVVVFTQFATATGGGVLVAHVGIAYAAGWSVFIYEIFAALGLVLLIFVAKWLRRKKFSTVPEILDTLFGGHRAIKSIAAACTIIVPFGWLVTQFVAFGKLFSQITGLSVTVLIVIVAAVSLLLVLPGGLLSVAWTDFLFGVFMFVMSIAVAVYAINMAGGWSGITAAVPEDLWRLPDGLTAAGGSTILLWLFAIVPGTLTNQLYYQRIYAAKEVRQVNRGLVLAALATLVAGVYAFCVGIGVRAANPTLGEENSEAAAGWFLAQLPTWLLAIYAAFLMATIVSTTGSALHSVVTNFVRDLYQGLAGGDRSERGLLNLSKLLTVVVTAVGALLAALYPTALDWLVATYAYSASALAAPIFLGYALRNRWQLRPSSALTAMVGGLLGCAIAQIMDTEVPYVVYGMGVSIVGMLITVAVRPRRVPEPETALVEEK
ncbi:MAG: sodium:solute symporter family protein [Pseudonocardiaceae bacterium]|nr:sodium:solute symporter family protein [Pseudonocardiaceae bacterium]